jgi:sulfatase modifying factor 1
MKNRYFLSSASIYTSAASGFRTVVLLFLLGWGLETSAQQVQTYTQTVNGVSFTMVLVEGYDFTFGCTGGGSDCNAWEFPPSEVTLSSYRIGETEVTQALWRAVMGDNPSPDKCDECPVTNVSWEDVQVFLNQLSILTGKKYELPTEAQWEFAARGGKTGVGYPGAVDRYAWHSGNSEMKLHPVKQKFSNGLRLYDMLGNAWEWCSDWYGPYTNERKIDPVGPPSGLGRVGRGGSCLSVPVACRISNRDHVRYDDALKNLGFRLMSK